MVSCAHGSPRQRCEMGREAAIPHLRRRTSRLRRRESNDRAATGTQISDTYAQDSSLPHPTTQDLPHLRAQSMRTAVATCKQPKHPEHAATCNFADAQIAIAHAQSNALRHRTFWRRPSSLLSVCTHLCALCVCAHVCAKDHWNCSSSCIRACGLCTWEQSHLQ